MEGATNLLGRYVPAELFELVPSLCFHPVYVYKHRENGMPIACVAGGHAGDIIGGIIFYRDASNELNMEIETTFEMMQFTFTFVAEMIANYEAPPNEVWDKFMTNLFNHISGKNGFTADGTPTPVFQPHALASPNPQSPQPVAPPRNNTNVEQNNNNAATHDDDTDDDDGMCMVCMEKEPNTMVLPCLHTVVCDGCSKALERTADKNICCQCRCPITGVSYPDGSYVAK